MTLGKLTDGDIEHTDLGALFLSMNGGFEKAHWQKYATLYGDG